MAIPIPHNRGRRSPIRDGSPEGGAAGEARFQVDERGGVTVVVEGHPQSYVDPADPGFLAFEYVAHLGAVVDAVRPVAPEPVRVTHVGGAGLSLPRYVQHTRPGSPQIVLEPDAELTRAVRERLPLPRGHRIRVRAQTGEEGVAALASGSADVVVVDAYAQGRVPAALGASSFLSEVARVVAPGGVLAVNLADAPDRRYTARFAAGVAAVGLGEQALIATHDVLKGRRFGNAVLAAWAPGGRLDLDDLHRAVARSPFPTGLRGPSACARAFAGARPFGEDAPASPEPPQPGAWRAR